MDADLDTLATALYAHTDDLLMTAAARCGRVRPSVRAGPERQ
jgi:hypothetical protein